MADCRHERRNGDPRRIETRSAQGQARIGDATHKPIPGATQLVEFTVPPRQYRFVPSEENNKPFGQTQSFVAGDPTNVQFMVKDSKTYASTGGWGYGHFSQDGTPGGGALLETYSPCHATALRDSVFTRYTR